MSYQIEFKKKMVHLYLEEGRSLKSLSEEYGVSSASICSWAKQEHPVPVPGKKI